jgi:hypothetical protein
VKIPHAIFPRNKINEAVSYILGKNVFEHIVEQFVILNNENVDRSFSHSDFLFKVRTEKGRKAREFVHPSF